MPDESTLRQKLIQLDKERRKLHTQLIKPQKLISGSLYAMYKKCGNPKCKCNKAEAHGPFLCLSVMKKRKRKLIFIRKKDELKVKHMNWKHKKYTVTIKKIVKRNEEIVRI